MTVTLDDASCLLHLSIDGRFLGRNGPLAISDVVDLMV